MGTSLENEVDPSIWANWTRSGAGFVWQFFLGVVVGGCVGECVCVLVCLSVFVSGSVSDTSVLNAGRVVADFDSFGCVFFCLCLALCLCLCVSVAVAVLLLRSGVDPLPTTTQQHPPTNNHSGCRPRRERGTQ